MSVLTCEGIGEVPMMHWESRCVCVCVCVYRELTGPRDILSVELKTRLDQAPGSFQTGYLKSVAVGPAKGGWWCVCSAVDVAMGKPRGLSPLWVRRFREEQSVWLDVGGKKSHLPPRSILHLSAAAE